MRFDRGGRYGGKEEEEVRVDVTPLVDMMFQFLIFFLLTTTFVSNAGFEVDLPKSSTAEHLMEAKDIVVVITPSKELLYNQEQVSETELAGILEQEHGTRPDVTVIVQADQSVDHGRVIHIMDIIRKAGFSKLAVATLSQ